MHNLRIAAVLVLVYGATQLLAGVFYIAWSGDTGEVLRMSFRVGVSAITVYGLWKSTQWGWWLGVIFSGIVVLFGIVGLAFGWAIGLFAGRPYPAIDVLFSLAGIGLMAGALAYLLLPSSRQVVLME